MKDMDGLRGTWGSRGWASGVGAGNPGAVNGPRGAAFAEGVAPIAGLGVPLEGAAVTPGVTVPTYELFDANAVFLAALLGSPVAGGILMAINYKRLGKGGAAVGAIVMGIGVTAIAALAGYFTPGTYAAGISVAFVVAMKGLAQAMQGKAVEHHEQLGGELASRWAAAGVGLVMLAVLSGVLFVAIYGQLGSTKVVIGTKDEVVISGGSTKEDAKALGQALQTTGYFKDIGASVLLDKAKDGANKSKNGDTDTSKDGEKAGTTISFVVKEGFWDQPGIVPGFEELGRELAPSVGGFPIKVRLVNAAKEVKKDLTVGRVPIGTKDEIYYLGSATAADATALGQSLKAEGFFADRGVTVMLAKGDGRTAISFVVSQGAWDQPDKVQAFETLVQGCEAAVGGGPIKLRLTNSQLELKKEVVVN
jgi:hypothetical protein